MTSTLKRNAFAMTAALWMAYAPVRAADMPADKPAGPAAAVAAATTAAMTAAAKPATAPAKLVVPQPELEKLLAAYAMIKQNYVGKTDDKALFDGALSGMLASLDPHSSYLDKDAMLDMARDNAGEYVGIGIEVESHDHELRVVSATEGSPAERAGVSAGDIIVAVDGTSVYGLSNDDVARRMRGVPGTVVTVALAHPGKPQGGLRTLQIARTELHNATVTTRMAASGLAWIRISEFGGATGADLVAALKKLDGKDTPRGVILDLRNDPGGLVSSAVAVVGAFVPKGTEVFSARGREKDAGTTVTVDERYYREQNDPDILADLPAWTRTVPLTVLVNGASASAAELVTGALQDNHRATVIGTQTFGKGSIQSVIPLGDSDDDGGVKFTVARYFTPGGHEIQAHGVTPDILVAPKVVDNDDLLLREADLANHLQPIDGAAAATAKREAAEPSRLFGTRDDTTLQTAVALLTPEDKRSASLSALLRKWNSDLKLGAATASATGAP
jgi:carboxyl-terminal processing protease